MFKKIIELFKIKRSQEAATAFEQDAEEATTTLAPKSNAGDDDLTEED